MTVLLVELGYIFYAWALAHRPEAMSAAQAAHAAAETLLSRIRVERDKLRADRVVLVTDPARPSFRVPLLNEAQRKRKAESDERRTPEARAALIGATCALETEGAVVVEPSGVDARDVIATVARWWGWAQDEANEPAAARGSRLRILSGRLEIAALASDACGIDVAREVKGTIVVDAEAASRARLPCAPERLADWQALESLPQWGEMTVVRAMHAAGNASALDVARDIRDGRIRVRLTAPQMAALAEASRDDFAAVRRAVFVAKLQDNVPIDVERIVRGEREHEGEHHQGSPRDGVDRREAGDRAAASVVRRDIKPENEERTMTTREPEQDVRTQRARRINERSERIKGLFRARAKELASLFPRDGMVMVTRAVQTACSASMKLDPDVTAESIAEQAMALHHLGLELGDQAYIYPYKDKGVPKARLTVGPRGLIALAYRSGFVKSIVARSVIEGDEFDYNLGTNEITHRKSLEGRRPKGRTPEELITHAYVLIDTTTDGRILDVLTWEDIGFYRSFSKASSGPWFDNYEGMCRKTAIKRGLEFVPRSPLLSAAMAETEEGAYEVPAEISDLIERAIAKRDGKPAPERHVVPDEMVPGSEDASWVGGDMPSQAEAS